MPADQFDRSRLVFNPLAEREDRVFIERDHVPPGAPISPLSEPQQVLINEAVERLRSARAAGAARMLVFGAHAIKNGLAPVIKSLIGGGWITHLATNGAGIIHDWEFAFQGHSSEHVAQNVARGAFGAWLETGYYLNLAINAGAYRGLGYGEAVGKFVEEDGAEIPAVAALLAEVQDCAAKDPARAAAALDFAGIIQRFELEQGRLPVAHPFKEYGLQAAAYRMGVPFTSHPMFGHDIIYLHPMNHGASVGRAAERDFLSFAQAVSNLENGVYLSIGSAVMSPMIFEKSLSMAQNIALQSGRRIENHYMFVVDLAESHWDWTQGEPPHDNPDYYLRYNKSFSRMGGTMRYLSCDNRNFLLTIARALGV